MNAEDDGSIVRAVRLVFINLTWFVMVSAADFGY